MHPAYSVIIFTTFSGAGYGLLFWLSLAHSFGLLPDERWLSFGALALALALITIGLLSSTLHLGHPERALKAFSQWRSSWLSREGVLAVVTYVPSGLLGMIWLFGIESALTIPLALLSALGAALTVYCTGMIYASLRTIRQWHQPLTPFVYLGFASATGALLLGLILTLFGKLPAPLGVMILANFVVVGWMKHRYWRSIDADAGHYTVEMATGLAGPVRSLDPPHTRPNFVMREMGYRVARKHREKLRRIVFVFLVFAPPILVALASFSPWVIALVLYLMATASATVGVMTERWLFFAEAEHVSQLYYGRHRA